MKLVWNGIEFSEMEDAEADRLAAGNRVQIISDGLVDHTIPSRGGMFRRADKRSFQPARSARPVTGGCI